MTPIFTSLCWACAEVAMSAALHRAALSARRIIDWVRILSPYQVSLCGEAARERSGLFVRPAEADLYLCGAVISPLTPSPPCPPLKRREFRPGLATSHWRSNEIN